MYRENPEEADDRQYYDYYLDRNGSPLEAENQALRQPPVIGSVCDFCKGEGSMWDGEFRDCDACKGSGKQTDL